MTTQTVESAAATDDAALRLALYRSMLRIRMVEEEIASRYAEQEMRCPVHLSTGQEAVASGACLALRPTDQIVTNHRCHAHYLAKGGSLNAMMAEIYGRATGCCGGRGGSMHLFDNRAGVLASVPIVASSIPLGAGAALAFQRLGQDRLCLVFLGDGATEEGAFHETTNFAVVRELPVIFLIENNLYSCYTGLEDRQPRRPLTDLARADGMPASHVDGNDAMRVYHAVAAAVTRARSGKGPTLIVADTYRWREHCGPNFDNTIGYRATAEFETWRAHCPVAALETSLRADGILSKLDVSALNREIAQEVESAFAFAADSPFPDPETNSGHVYA